MDSSMRVTITITRAETRVLVQDANGDCMRARLPAFTSCTHHRALPTLLESLALWCNQAVPVVLCVDESFEWRRTSLSDTLDIATGAFLYQIEVVPLPRESQSRAKRLTAAAFARERSVRRRKTA
jgi:hypothetical protein